MAEELSDTKQADAQMAEIMQQIAGNLDKAHRLAKEMADAR